MRSARRRPCLVALLVALLASSCGGGGGGLADAGDTTTTATPGTRTVRHDMGVTEVPVEPERVVTLDSPHLDAALSLGVTPVGSVRSAVDQGLPAYLGHRVRGVEIVGTIEEPDLEAIAALDPDLILSATVRHEAIYDELTEIAPTVFTASSGTNWKEGFRLVAEALGGSERGERELADYRRRAETLAARTGADDMRVSIVRFLPDETRIYGTDTFSGSVLTDVGFQLPDLDYDEYSMVYISPEQIELADGDAIFAATYGDPKATTRKRVSALWGSLSAVREGCQFDVEDGEWMIGIGLIGADLILDDLETFLGDRRCS